MENGKGSGRTLVLALPASCEEPKTATEKWLLSLWQASTKRTWSLWRNQATVSLEYVAAAGLARFQLHLGSPVLADLTRAVLGSLIPRIEYSSGDAVPEILAKPLPGALTTLGLRSPGWVDLPKDVAPEGVAGVLGALAELREGEGAIVQLLLEPTWMTTEDGKQPAFWLSGRIAAFAAGAQEARSRSHLIASAFGQFAGFNGVHLSSSRTLTASDRDSILARHWPRRLLPAGRPATAQQVATLYHPPRSPSAHGNLLVTTAPKTPTVTTTDGVPLGEGRDARGRPADVRLRPEDLLRHALVVGPSGSGKTTFLVHLARELIGAGHGVTVLDPHGGLARDVTRSIPSGRRTDAYLFRLSDSEYPVSINPLKARPGQEFLAADELVEVIQRVQGREYWGPLLDLLLRHAALGAMQLGGSLIETARLLDDPWFRSCALPRLESGETARFLSQLGDGGFQDRRSLPAVNRLHRLLATPWLRNILAQSDRALDFEELFERRSIALFDLSGIGATNARLIGSLLLLLVRQATLARNADGGAAPLHFVLVDEASWFVSRTVAELLDQARKFGVGVVLAVQRLGQLSSGEVREAVLANAANVVAFRITDEEEAKPIARRLASETVGAYELQHLPRYEAYVQLTRDGERLEPAWLRTRPAPGVTNGHDSEELLIAGARARFARPRAEVEEELRRRERFLIDNDEPEIRGLAIPQAALSAHAP